MKMLVLGCGNIGFVAAKDLAESLPSAEITVADVNADRARDAASSIHRENVSWVQADASDHHALVRTLKQHDLALGALPGPIGYRVCEGAIAAGVDLVDVSYMPEDVMTLHDDASKAEISILPDFGMSPGLGSIFVGHAVSKLDRVESVHMLNGGLPEEPIPPLGYVITWSVKDLIDMYSRRVTIVKGGRKVEVEAMTGLNEIDFPDVGKLEAFYTDGLRTLLYTIKGVKDMWEKSLRYPGHNEKIKLLRDVGLFDEKPLKVGKHEVSPRDFAAVLLEDKLKRKDIPDIVAMRVDVIGKKNGNKVNYVYHMLERFDREHHVTAMARTTAYTTSIAAQLLATKGVVEKGVFPPEKLGMNNKLYSCFMGMMKKRGVSVKETKEILE